MEGALAPSDHRARDPKAFAIALRQRFGERPLRAGVGFLGKARCSQPAPLAQQSRAAPQLPSRLWSLARSYRSLPNSNSLPDPAGEDAGDVLAVHRSKNRHKSVSGSRQSKIVAKDESIGAGIYSDGNEFHIERAVRQANLVSPACEIACSNGGRRLTLGQPVVGVQAGAGVVEAEVVVRDADGTVRGDRNNRQEGLPIHRGDVERSLVDTNWRRPGEAAVRGHRERDVVYQEIRKAPVFPDGIKIAVAAVHSERGVRWIGYLSPGFRIDN